MILETLPSVQRLSPEQRLQLAEELWNQILPPSALTSNDEALTRLLDARYAEYQKAPETAGKWQDVRERLIAARQCMKS